jgi:nucleotide-binding universal stress UspA family protein
MADFENGVVGVQVGAAIGEESPGRAASSSPGAREFESVIVGLDGREHDADAIALGRSLLTALGGSLCLAYVIPRGPSGQGRMALEALEREDGRRLLAQAAGTVRGRVETEVIDPSPAAEGLARLATKRGDSILVVGSSHRGSVGRVVPGGVASHLLVRAPCAIAVAPAGYAKLPDASVVRIGVAYDGTSESDLALAAAAAAATRLSVPLRLYHAMHAVSKDAAWDKFRRHMEDFARNIVDVGLKKLPPQLEATSSVLEGDVAAVIAKAARDDDVALLYVGSRGYGPLREALFGGVACSLLRTARCPVVIVPRSSEPNAQRERR